MMTSHFASLTAALSLGTLAFLGSLRCRAHPADEQPPKAPSPAAVSPAAPADQAVPRNAEADKAWEEVTQAARLPKQPKEWTQQPPTPEQRAEYRGKLATAALSAADVAKAFRVRFPQEPRVVEARRVELRMLQSASLMGRTNVAGRLTVLEKEHLADVSLPENERVALWAQQIERQAEARRAEGRAAVAAELAKGASELKQEFPTRTEPYRLLLSAAAAYDPPQARLLVDDLLRDTNMPPHLKESASSLLRRLDVMSKPLDLKFTAVDGRQVDLAALRGKVVLLSFWATWNGPCVADLASLKTAYDKLNPRGFEIIGISLDQFKERLTNCVAKEQLPWPQYFDGKGWQNDLREQLGVFAIPAMWLIDRKGFVRDMNVRLPIEAKAEPFLAEQP